MKKTSLLAAAVLAAVAAPAFAAGSDWGTHEPIEVATSFDRAGDINDVFTFTLDDVTTLSASAVSNNLGHGHGKGRGLHIADGLVSLFQSSNGTDSLIGSFSFDGTTGDLAHSFVGLAAGSYRFVVTGMADGRAGGLYTLSSTSVPVPEPDTYALMLGGLAMLGFGGRQLKARRSNAG